MFASIVNLIGTVIWPLTVIALVLYFRKPLRELISRVRSFKGPAGIEGTFAGEVEGASRLLDVATNEVVEKRDQPEGNPSDDQVGDNRDESAAGVVLNAWKRYEQAVGPVSTGGTLTGVRDLPAPAVAAIKQLKRLRDRVAHGESVTADTAEVYANSINQTLLLVSTTRDVITEHFFERWQRMFNDLVTQWVEAFGDESFRPFTAAVEKLADEGYIRRVHLVEYRSLDDKFEWWAGQRSGPEKIVGRSDLRLIDTLEEILSAAIDRRAEDKKHGRPPAPLPLA